MATSTKDIVIVVLAIVVIALAGILAWQVYFRPAPEVNPIKVGYCHDLTGPGAPTGLEQLKGVQVWVHEVNEIKGGILGRRVELSTADEASSPDEGILAIEKLILEDEVCAIIWGGYSSVAMAAAPLCNQYKTPALLTIQSSVAVQDIMTEGKYIWRPWGYIEGWAAAMVGTIKDVVVPMIHEEYGLEVSEIRWQLVRSGDEAARSASVETLKYMDLWLPDMPIPYDEIVVDYAATDFTSELALIKDRNVDVVTSIMWSAQSPLWAKQFAEAELPCITGGLGDISSAPVFWEATGPTRLGVFGMAYYPIWIDMTPLTAHYRDLYEEYWGHESSPIASHTYDAGLVLEDAIIRAGSDDREAIADALAETDMEGIKGLIKFNPETHDLEDPWFTMVQYVPGTAADPDGIKMVLVYPTDWTESPGPWLPDYYVPSTLRP